MRESLSFGGLEAKDSGVGSLKKKGLLQKKMFFKNLDNEFID